jgi:type II secretory pathway predicted ATPase ExeA
MDRVSVRPFSLEEEQLFVVAVGDLGAGKDVAVCRALTGCIRILSERQG